MTECISQNYKISFRGLPNYFYENAAECLVLAETEGISLIKPDEGLTNEAKKGLKWVRWLGET
jgi:hypothetical protein